MTQARLKFARFADYLAWSDDPANYLEGRFELVDGELVEVPPESESNKNRERDLISKKAQYAARCIPEYWLMDPEAETVTVLVWENGVYPESQTTGGNELISSFPHRSFQSYG